MKKFFILAMVLSVLLFWNCSSSQEKECECPPQTSQQDEKSQQPADNKTATSDQTATRSGEAEQASGEKEQPASSGESSSTSPASKQEVKEETKTQETASSKTDEKSEEVKETASATGSFPDPKTPIAQKPLNTASSILGGSGEKETASSSQTTSTRTGSGESESPSSEGTSKDQIRKIDRESDYVIPPQYAPVKGSQSTNQPTQPNTQSNVQNTPAPQGAGGSFSLKCEDFNEDTKSVVCRGNSSSLKGDSILEFDARKFKKLFMGFDLTIRSGEIEVQIPGSSPIKATPTKPFVYLGEVQSNNDKVQVRIKAEPQEAKEIDYIVRLFYHGKG